MVQAEQTSSMVPPQAANDAIFSVGANNAVNSVIDIAEARKMLKVANSNSQSFMAWVLDITRKVTGTENTSPVMDYARLVSLKTSAVAASHVTVNSDPIELQKVA